MLNYAEQRTSDKAKEQTDRQKKAVQRDRKNEKQEETKRKKSKDWNLCNEITRKESKETPKEKILRQKFEKISKERKNSDRLQKLQKFDRVSVNAKRNVLK